MRPSENLAYVAAQQGLVKQLAAVLPAIVLSEDFWDQAKVVVVREDVCVDLLADVPVLQVGGISAELLHC